MNLRLPLFLHPDSRCEAVQRIDVGVDRHDPGCLTLGFQAIGRIGELLIPAPATPSRTDRLWQHMCFEAFFRGPDGSAYAEFNFSPSGQWAAYRFDGYRSGMAPLTVSPPSIRIDRQPGACELLAKFDLPEAAPLRLALSAVIEETNGRISYWALAHPAAKPDFHHPDSFVHELS